jgi:hypothetical protein
VLHLTWPQLLPALGRQQLTTESDSAVRLLRMCLPRRPFGDSNNLSVSLRTSNTPFHGIFQRTQHQVAEPLSIQ